MFDSQRVISAFLLAAAMLILAGCSGKKEAYFPHDISDMEPEAAIAYGRLDNGLRYAVMHNATPSNTASLLMHIDTGSINEADDERGLAHFLEHMAFNGSKNIPEGEMIPRLEKFGLAFGPDTNASTGFQDTNYQLELPEVNDEIIDEALFIMRETASNLLLDPEAIDKERGVILAEKRARTNAAYNASIAQLSYFLEGTLIPDRLPIGEIETIQSVTADQFRAFYDGYYRPENAFIVLVGDFETDYAAAKIAQYFADWEGQGTAKKSYEIKPLKARGKSAEYYSDPEIQTSVSLNIFGPPDLRGDSKANRRDFYIEALGNRILSRRLAKLAQTTEASFISGGASTSTAYDAARISSVTMSTQPERWADALITAEQELRRAYEFGFTQAELNEQLANSRRALEVSVERAATRRTPSLARSILGSYTADNTKTSPAFNLELFNRYADDITPEQIHNAFKINWTGLENPQIYLSTSAILEDPESEILTVFDKSRTVELTRNSESEIVDFAYIDFGEPGKIESKTVIEDIDFTQIVFENGVRLNMKKTPYRKGTMAIQIAYGNGELQLPENGQGLRWLIGNALSLGGLVAHSADDITTLMAGKTVGVGHDIGTRQMFMSGSTTPEDLSEQMNLMMAYFTAPGFRDEAKSRYDKLISSFYPTLDSTPGGVASRDIDRLIRSNDSRFGIPDEQVLRSAKLSQVSAWMENSVPGSLIEIGVVGDIDLEVITSEVARTFGTLPAIERTMPLPSKEAVTLKFPEGKTRPTVLTHAGEENTAMLRVYWPSYDGRDDMMLRRVNVAKSMFQLRLTEIIREELGASYSPSAFFNAPRVYPNYGYLGVSLEVAPDEIDKAEARIHALANEFASGDLDRDLFERAIQPIRENIEETLESNSYWMGIISQSQTDPERVERHRRRHDAYQSMSLDDVKSVSAAIFKRDKAVSYHIVPDE